MHSTNYVKGSWAVFANTYLLQTKQPNYDAKAILWPVNMWQVYTNKPQGRELNVFEKTILQLFNVTGKRSLKNEDVANWLGLETDMVSYIITAQLIPNGWLTEKGQVTSKGVELLNDEVNDSLTTAYIFQCAITGKWLPRLCFSLNEIYTSNDDTHRPKFKLKRASDSVTIPFVVTAHSAFNSAPSEHDLATIAAEFQDAVYIAKNTRNIDEWQKPPSSFDKLTLASQSATSVYLTVWGDTTTSFEWTLYDPFAISSTSTWMTTSFKQGCKENKALGNYALSQLGVSDKDLSYDQACLKFAEDAKLKVLVKYPRAGQINDLTDAIFQLFELQERLEQESYSRSAANTEFIIKGIKVVEVVCSYILERYPLDKPTSLPKPHTKNARELLKHMIVSATNMNNEMVEQVLALNASRVYAAAVGKNSSVRAQLAAIFISMETHQQHPLKFLLEQQTYFSNFYKITHLRDECSHGSSINIAHQQIKTVISTVDTFLNKLFNGIENNG
jgi:hypothetical protein